MSTNPSLKKNCQTLKQNQLFLMQQNKIKEILLSLKAYLTRKLFAEVHREHDDPMMFEPDAC